MMKFYNVSAIAISVGCSLLLGACVAPKPYSADPINQKPLSGTSVIEGANAFRLAQAELDELTDQTIPAPKELLSAELRVKIAEERLAELETRDPPIPDPIVKAEEELAEKEVQLTDTSLPSDTLVALEQERIVLAARVARLRDRLMPGGRPPTPPEILAARMDLRLARAELEAIRERSRKRADEILAARLKLAAAKMTRDNAYNRAISSYTLITILFDISVTGVESKATVCLREPACQAPFIADLVLASETTAILVLAPTIRSGVYDAEITVYFQTSTISDPEKKTASVAFVVH